MTTTADLEQAMTAGSTSGGAVYDRGYRTYAGPIGGRGQVRWALVRLTVRRVLGLRRSWRQKVMPWSLLGLATIPVLINVGVRFSMRGEPADEVDVELLSFRDLFEVTMLLMVLFVALTAPDALCPDRRHRILSLLFSRPLTGVDYVLAKVAAMTVVIFSFSLLPQAVLFVGQAVVHDDGALDYARDNAGVGWQVPLAAAALAVFFAVIGVALSSLTDRRLVGGVAILGLWLTTMITSSILVLSGAETDGGGELLAEQGSSWALLDVFNLPLALRDVVFLGHIDRHATLGGVSHGAVMALALYVGVLAVASVVLVRRYREVKL